jgi:hypothetical protein
MRMSASKRASAVLVRVGAVGLALLAVLVSALVVPAGAGARTAIPTAPLLAGPVLAGGRVVWAPTTSKGFAVRQAPFSGPASTVARFRDTGGGWGLFPQLAASRSRIVLASALGNPDTAWGLESVYSAPVGGGFEPLERDCSLGGLPQLPRTVDVSGELVVFWRCAEPRGAIVRDYATSPPTDQMIPGARPLGLRIAGRYVAWLQDCCGPSFETGITVYDRVAGTVAYQIPKAAMPGELHSFDLQDDGTVAFSYAADVVGGKVGWASIAQPTPHRLALPLARDFSYEVRISGNRIAFQAARQAGEEIVSLGDIGVTDLQGHSRLIGNLAEGTYFTDDFDYDGHRLAWWSYGCTKTLIRVADANGPPQLDPPRQGCALRFTSAPRRSGRRVELHIDCFGFAITLCTTHNVVFTIRRGHRQIVVGRGATAAHVTLLPEALHLVRQHGHLKVHVHATLTDDAGRRETRTATTTIP